MRKRKIQEIYSNKKNTFVYSNDNFFNKVEKQEDEEKKRVAINKALFYLKNPTDCRHLGCSQIAFLSHPQEGF